MVKVVLGDSFFNLPEHAWIDLIKMGFNIRVDTFRDEYQKENRYNYGDLDEETFRTDPRLIKLVEGLIKSGEVKTGVRLSEDETLNIIEVPDDVDWYIHDGECGGGEYIVECHRSWSNNGEHSWCKEWGSYKYPRKL